MSLTPRGWMFAAFLSMLYIGAVRVSSGLLFLVLGVLAGCFILDFLKVRRAGRSPDSAPRGRFVFEEGERVSIPSLGLQDSVFSRGEYFFRRISAKLPGPMGLFARTAGLPGQGSVLITPRVFEIELPRSGELIPVVGGGAEGSHPSRSGGVFRGARKYLPGDSIMMIHWKASAKGLGMMSKEFSGEMAGCSAIWIDPGAGGRPGGEVLDEACRLAGSLSSEAIDRKNAVEFIVWGRGKISGSGHLPGLGEILENLAVLRPRASPGGYGAEAAELAARMPPSTSHAFILASAVAETVRFIEELSSSGKTVVVYIPRGRVSAGGGFPDSRLSSLPVFPYPEDCKS